MHRLAVLSLVLGLGLPVAAQNFPSENAARAACDANQQNPECVTPCSCSAEPCGDGTACGAGFDSCGTCLAPDPIFCFVPEVLITRYCEAATPQCVVDADCDDGLACNGVETCGGGACVAGTDLDCNDNIDCTVDSCAEPSGCANVVEDLDLCSCPAGTPATFAAEFSPPPVGFAAACPPLLGGGFDFGAQAEPSFSISAQDADCNNGCVESQSASIEITAAFEACVREIELTGAASYSYDADLCATCDATSCQDSCGPGGCETRQASGTLGASVSGFVGSTLKTPPQTGPVRLSGRCGGTLGAGAELSFSGGSTVDDGACVACETCDQTELSGSLSGRAGFTCMLEIEGPWGVEFDVGCDGCAAIGVEGTLGSQDRSGACGDELCGFARSDASLKLKTPSLDLAALWFKVPVACEYSFSLCEEANTCGECTCGGALCAEADAGGGCTVLGVTP